MGKFCLQKLEVKYPAKSNFSLDTVPSAGKWPLGPYVLSRHLLCLQLEWYLISRGILGSEVNQNHSLRINASAWAIITDIELKPAHSLHLGEKCNICPNVTVTWCLPRSILRGARQVTQVWKVNGKSQADD